MDWNHLCETRRIIHYYPYMAKIAGDVLGGLLLSRIIFLPKDDESRIKSQDGELWVLNSFTDWAEDLGTNPTEIEKALELLKKKNLIFVDFFEHEGKQYMVVIENQNTLAKELYKKTG